MIRFLVRIAARIISGVSIWKTAAAAALKFPKYPKKKRLLHFHIVFSLPVNLKLITDTELPSTFSWVILRLPKAKHFYMPGNLSLLFNAVYNIL